MVILKVAKKQSFRVSSDSIVFEIYSYGLGVVDFFQMNVNISFCRISSLPFYLNKNKLRKNC